MISRNKALTFIFFLFIAEVYSEGTKQILPAPTGFGKIQVMPTFNSFAWYTTAGVSAADDYKLFIHISNPGEKIFYGFGDPLSNNNNIVNSVWYRIKDPAGNIVVGPVLLPLAGPGHITNFARAVAGPDAVAGAAGYSSLLYQPLTTGDYYIEFHFDSTATDRVAFRYFDITVATAGNQAVDGRVWSKAWQFTTDDFGNSFYGKLFVYSNDSVVTSMNFNGMEPYVFTVSCNQFGCLNTGNFPNDRRSVTGRSTNPQFKTFLNNPDSIAYPTGIPGKILPPIIVDAPCDGTATVTVNVTKTGNISAVFDINLMPGIQAEDVVISLPVNPGANIFTWNGNNGLGQPLPSGTPVRLTVSYLTGLTNLPIYDVEQMTDGFIVQLIRPSGTDPQVFWDDSLLPGGTTQLTGCNYILPTTGCHSWTGGSNWGIGNNNTVNTWWYCVSSTAAPVDFKVRRIPGMNIIYHN